MKRLFFYLLFAMAMTLCYADGTYYNVSIGDFKYDLNYRTSGESTATLNGLADPSYSGYMYIPGYVDYSGKKYRVDKILNYAFKGNTKITRAYIDYGVTTIQTAAFENCTALNQVTMPKLHLAQEGSLCRRSASQDLCHNIQHRLYQHVVLHRDPAWS